MYRLSTLKFSFSEAAYLMATHLRAQRGYSDVEFIVIGTILVHCFVNVGLIGRSLLVSNFNGFAGLGISLSFCVAGVMFAATGLRWCIT